MTAVAPVSTSLAASGGQGSRKVKDRTATTLVYACFGVALIPLIWLLWTVLSKGLHAITRNGWFTHSQRGLTYRDPGGGALHAIIGTLEQVLLCTAISVPIAILVAIYLVEYGRGPIARATTFMVDILTGIPSIVAALFIYAAFITTFGLQRAGWLVSLALVMLMIPVIVRTTEEMLKLVPNELREASYALGVPKWKTIVKIVLPTAMSGIITGVVLGIARVAGETAPLLILVGYSPNRNSDLFQGTQGSLPGMIKDQFSNIGNTTILQNGHKVTVHYAADRMWGAALTLIVLVMALNLLARLIARRSKVSN
ncbi:phosphate ABC transporter permease PstA [Jatrophihabitans telluris]|uniref:Phosphate transport system permease protein PstA n=1 Tax=Jatrophihabitans telluris TaxID=2038343 RepID=A0ABY4QYQ9_9ACTN|nr:phosphate ABC transporter permease PstA [Jatrophihabitans telluris]UQX88773.1 phosphate ABC transporter permease PstA [Jatrophihabitans telluris]